MQNPYEIDVVSSSIFETFSRVTQDINRLTINRKKNKICDTKNDDKDDISTGIKRLKLGLDIDTDKKINVNINTSEKKRKYNKL